MSDYFSEYNRRMNSPSTGPATNAVQMLAFQQADRDREQRMNAGTHSSSSSEPVEPPSFKKAFIGLALGIAMIAGGIALAANTGSGIGRMTGVLIAFIGLFPSIMASGIFLLTGLAGIFSLIGKILRNRFLWWGMAGFVLGVMLKGDILPLLPQTMWDAGSRVLPLTTGAIAVIAALLIRRKPKVKTEEKVEEIA